MATYTSVASRESSVLVVIDLQDALAAAMSHRDRVIQRAILMIEAAAIVGLPIIVTRQYPKGLGDLCSPIAAALVESEQTGGSVARVDKVAFDCLSEPSFVQALESSGRRQLLVCGMESHICVTQTALAALGSGYDVHVADDACCSRDDRAHETAMARIRAAGSVVTTSESVAYELVGQAGTLEFKRLLAAVKRG